MQSAWLTSLNFRNCLMLTTVSLVAVSLAAAIYADEFQPPRDIVFHARVDGSPQQYVLMLPRELHDGQAVDLMVALHGHGSDRWQFARDARDECRAAREMAAEHGMIYVCPDYRAKTSWMSPKATADMLQILEELKLQYKIRRIMICGGSMGGSAALAFATLYPSEVHGVVSMNGTANLLTYGGFTDAMEAAYEATKRDKPDLYRERSAELFPARLKFPVALTTGGQDTLVPPDSSLRLAAGLKQLSYPCLSIHRPEGGHDTNLEDARAAIKFVLDNW